MDEILLVSDELLQRNYNKEFIGKMRASINLVTKKAFKNRQG